MKLKNSIWSRLTNKSKKLFLWGAKKQSENKVESLSTSIVERRTPTYKPLLLLLPTLLILGLFTIFPLFLNIYWAFTPHDKSEIKGATIENFKDLIADPTFAVGLRNSIIYGLLTLPFVMAISLLISSLIATVYRKWARGIWQTIFFLPYVTNAIAVSLTFIQMFSITGLFNSAFGIRVDWLKEGDIFGYKAILVLFIKGIWSGLAFNILIFTTAMLSVDKNLYRSASIDGIGGFKQFFTITLPSIKSTTSFLITMGIIGGIKVFPLALFENKPEQAIQNGASSLMLFVYKKISLDIHQASAAAIGLFVIGIIFSTLIRGGFSTIMKSSINLGEYNVWTKIKKSKEISKL